MEYFIQAKFVRLKSHHNKYLIAGERGSSVKQSRHGNTRRARWAVEFVQDNPNMIRLRSCYDEFLTASDESFLLGWTGKKVLQTVQMDNEPSVHWEPIRDINDFHVKLRNPVTGKFLRGNGGTPPWKNSVTVDVPERSATQNWVLWGVEILDDGNGGGGGGDGQYCAWPRNRVKTLPPASNDMADDIDIPWYSTTSSSSIEAQEEEDASLLDSPTHKSVYESNAAMDLFRSAKTIRLRSHHDKYLLADDDQESVNQDRHHINSKRARWTVEYVKSVEGVSLVRLKSCYNKYLTATDDDFFMGVTGKKVKQTMPRRLDSSLEWEPIRDGMQVKLKTRYGNFLRANGGVPPWRNSITHDVPSRSHTQDWILWEIDVLEVYEKIPEENKESANEDKEKEFERCESEVEPFTFMPPSHRRSESVCNNEGRLIHYNVVDDDGNIVEGDYSINFNGNGVDELTQMLGEQTGLADVTVCSRNPLNEKLYPMRLALPPNHVKLHVYVVPSSSKAAAELATNDW